MKEVEVVVQQDAVGAWPALVGEIEALVLGARAIDSIRVDHEVEGPEALADADERLFGVARPGVEAAEPGQHALEVGLEAFRVERAYETGRVERAANVGVVDVEHVARDASGQKILGGACVGEQGARVDAGRAAALEGLQHARRLVSFPAQKLNHVAGFLLGRARPCPERVRGRWAQHAASAAPATLRCRSQSPRIAVFAGIARGGGDQHVDRHSSTRGKPGGANALRPFLPGAHALQTDGGARLTMRQPAG